MSDGLLRTDIVALELGDSEHAPTAGMAVPKTMPRNELEIDDRIIACLRIRQF